jgi:hypothetical protein
MVALGLAANTHPILRRAHGLYWIVIDISTIHYAVSAETSDRVRLVLVLPTRARLGQTPHVALAIGTSSISLAAGHISPDFLLSR